MLLGSSQLIVKWYKGGAGLNSTHLGTNSVPYIFRVKARVNKGSRL